MMPPLDEKDALVDACRVLARLQVDDFLLSLLSVRTADGSPRYKPFPVGLDEVRSLDLEPLPCGEGDWLADSRERSLAVARAIYHRSAEVGAVFLVYPTLAAAYAGSSIAREGFPPIGHQGAAFAPRIFLLDSGLHPEEEAERIVDLLPGAGVALSSAGGCWVLARDPAQAVVLTATLLRALQLQMLAVLFRREEAYPLVCDFAEAEAKSASLFFLNKANATFDYLLRTLVGETHA